MRIIIFYCLLFLFTSCATTAQIDNNNIKANICSFLDSSKVITWEQIMDASKLELKPTIRQTKLPSKFTVYKINENDLKAFLKSVSQATSPVTMFVPLYSDCIPFKISPSGTMTKELAAKFPDIISLKGTAVNAELTTVRIDYKEDNLEMEIHDQGQVYLMETWPGKDGNYFLLFNKNDAGYSKSQLKSY